jgi:hypothetical protein
MTPMQMTKQCRQGATPDGTICVGLLTFDSYQQASDKEDTLMATANHQVEHMRWHYHLGHLLFKKLKQLALNGEICKKFAKVPLPKCLGCLLGAMT